MSGFIGNMGLLHLKRYLVGDCNFIDNTQTATSTEQNKKFKFSMQTLLTHINTEFEYCHSSVALDNVDFVFMRLECIKTSSEHKPQLCFS